MLQAVIAANVLQFQRVGFHPCEVNLTIQCFPLNLQLLIFRFYFTSPIFQHLDFFLEGVQHDCLQLDPVEYLLLLHLLEMIGLKDPFDVSEIVYFVLRHEVVECMHKGFDVGRLQLNFGNKINELIRKAVKT